MWNRRTYTLSSVVGKKHTFTYTYTPAPGSVFQVKQLPDKSYFLVPSCGCSTPNWNPNTLTLTVDFTAPQVPEHLVLEGKNSFNAAKTITVYATLDGQPVEDVLTFSMHIVDPRLK